MHLSFIFKNRQNSAIFKITLLIRKKSLSKPNDASSIVLATCKCQENLINIRQSFSLFVIVKYNYKLYPDLLRT